jgi:hypothetical protein
MLMTTLRDPERIHIFEGTDGVGKTTIATMDSTARAAVYLHAVKPTHDNWYDEYVKPLTIPDQRFTLDRWHVGEIIWPRLFRRASLFKSFDDYRKCCTALNTLGAHVHLVIRPAAEIERELKERKEARSAIKASLQAQEMFLHIIELTSNYMPVSIWTAATLFNSSRTDRK